MEDIKMKVRQFLEQKKGKKEFKDDDDLFELGFVDSIFALQLVLFLEKEFKIKITNKDIKEDNFRTIDTITDTVVRIKG